jgi:hypothetical protein
MVDAGAQLDENGPAGPRHSRVAYVYEDTLMSSKNTVVAAAALVLAAVALSQLWAQAPARSAPAAAPPAGRYVLSKQLVASIDAYGSHTTGGGEQRETLLDTATGAVWVWVLPEAGKHFAGHRWVKVAEGPK